MDVNVNNALTVFWVVLVLSAVVIGRWALKRRKRTPRWHEQPRRTYKPELAELEDVQRREYRRPV